MLVYVSSKKQKCMSKSPTEAELIGLTDNLGLIELFQEFVEFVTMKRVNPPTIYQDCNAVGSLVTKGGGQTRTKHLRARMNLDREMVSEKRVVVKHISGEDMIADGFSKPYDPAEHRKLKSILMPSVNGDNGWALSKVQGKDPGEIRAKSQSRTQQDAKRGSAGKKRNGKKSETAK
jgi:hypothetical protein